MQYLLTNIQPIGGREKAIIAYKQYYNVIPKDAKEYIDKILSNKELLVDLPEVYNLKQFFTFDKREILSKEEEEYQEKIKDAEQWYNLLTKKDKERVDFLVGTKILWATG